MWNHCVSLSTTHSMVYEKGLTITENNTGTIISRQNSLGN